MIKVKQGDYFLITQHFNKDITNDCNIYASEFKYSMRLYFLLGFEVHSDA